MAPTSTAVDVNAVESSSEIEVVVMMAVVNMVVELSSTVVSSAVVVVVIVVAVPLAFSAVAAEVVVVEVELCRTTSTRTGLLYVLVELCGLFFFFFLFRFPFLAIGHCSSSSSRLSRTLTVPFAGGGILGSNGQACTERHLMVNGGEESFPSSS